MSAPDSVFPDRHYSGPTLVWAARSPTTVAKIRMWVSGVFCRRTLSAGNCERQNMGRVIRATGWLRASGFGSSTATFEIDLGSAQATGRVQSEVAMIIEVMAAGRATLVAEAGRWIAIRPREQTADGLAFTVLDDPATVAGYFP